MQERLNPGVEFRGYSGDCLIQGRLVLPPGVRMTDYLNEAELLTVRGLTLHALAYGHVVDGGDQVLEMDEILAVEPTDPKRAGGERHVPTRALEVQIALGPYVIDGYVHSVSTADPVASITRRKPQIPVTDATIRYVFAGQPVERKAPVLIVNRERATSLEKIEYQKGLIDEMGMRPVDPHAKDLTQEISFDR